MARTTANSAARSPRAAAAVIGLPSTGGRLVGAARAAGVEPSRAVEAPDMAAAVAQARVFARPGSAVLLSPAAPSYDTYRNFEERGDDFRALVGVGITGPD